MDGKADKTRKPRGWGCTRKWREKSAPETPCFPRSNGWLAGSKVVFLPRLPLTSSSRWDGQGIREESFTGALSATLSSSSTTTAGAAAAAASIETFECGGNEAAAAVSQSAIFAAVCAVLLCIMAGERFYGPFLFPFALATHLMVW